MQLGHYTRRLPFILVEKLRPRYRRFREDGEVTVLVDDVSRSQLPKSYRDVAHPVREKFEKLIENNGEYFVSISFLSL